MRGWWIFLMVAAMLPPCVASAQVSRVATFENYVVGNTWGASFSDPLSGITFRDSTHPPAGGFAISHTTLFFGGGYYLTAGGVGETVFGADFGFTGDLPASANRVWMDVLYNATPTSGLGLKGFNAAGAVVASATAAVGLPNPIHLEVISAQYDIVRFQVTVGTGSQGYDNVGYTILPEPAELSMFVITVGAWAMRRRR